MTDRKPERRGLGRGLSALMADMDVSHVSTAPQEASAGRAEYQIRSVPIEDIFPNPNQPRREFDGAKLQELAESIASRGVLQPMIVRPRAGQAGFEIVAGERRWRAAQIAQLHVLPVIVREFDDETLLQVAIIENIQRSDLSPLEEARAFRQLIEQFGHTQEKVAEGLGKSRSYIANSLRLLTLPQSVLDMVQDGRLTAGHARALVTVEDPVKVAQEIIRKGLTVRDVEDLVRRQKNAGAAEAKPKSALKQNPQKDADTVALEKDLSLSLGMGVGISHDTANQSGVVKISYRSLDDLDQLCRILSGGLRG